MKLLTSSIKRKRNKFLDFFASLLPIYKYTISGNSMSPILKQGQVVLVNRLSYVFQHPNVSDIVVLKHPTKNMHLIKKIEKIEGKKYFVVGVNKKESTDSRHFGWIEKKDIIGKIITIFNLQLKSHIT